MENKSKKELILLCKKLSLPYSKRTKATLVSEIAIHIENTELGSDRNSEYRLNRISKPKLFDRCLRLGVSAKARDRKRELIRKLLIHYELKKHEGECILPVGKVSDQQIVKYLSDVETNRDTIANIARNVDMPYESGVVDIILRMKAEIEETDMRNREGSRLSYEHDGNWADLCKTPHLGVSFLRYWSNNIDWFIVSMFQKMTIPFMKEFESKLDWNLVASFNWESLTPNAMRIFRHRLQPEAIEFNFNVMHEFVDFSIVRVKDIIQVRKGYVDLLHDGKIAERIYMQYGEQRGHSANQFDIMFDLYEMRGN